MFEFLFIWFYTWFESFKKKKEKKFTNFVKKEKKVLKIKENFKLTTIVDEFNKFVILFFFWQKIVVCWLFFTVFLNIIEQEDYNRFYYNNIFNFYNINVFYNNFKRRKCRALNRKKSFRYNTTIDYFFGIYEILDYKHFIECEKRREEDEANSYDEEDDWYAGLYYRGFEKGSPYSDEDLDYEENLEHYNELMRLQKLREDREAEEEAALILGIDLSKLGKHKSVKIKKDVKKFLTKNFKAK